MGVTPALGNERVAVLTEGQGTGPVLQDAFLHFWRQCPRKMHPRVKKWTSGVFHKLLVFWLLSNVTKAAPELQTSHQR